MNAIEAKNKDMEIAEGVYTKINGAYVMPDPGDLAGLQLDGCLVAKGKGTLYAQPIETLEGKRVEAQRGEWDPVFGFDNGEADRFFILNGVRKECRFCDLCKDRLNGLTGNCFDYKVKPKGCSFQSAVSGGMFRISLEDRKKVKPTAVSKDSAFHKPYYPSGVSFDKKLIRKNRKLHYARYHLWELSKRKQEKYCSRCIFEGLCRINTRRVIEHCMVTNEKTESRCLDRIRKRFGSVEEFLYLLSYAGSVIRYKPKGAKRKTKWRVSYPLNAKRFMVRKLSRPFATAEVTRVRIAKQVNPKPLPLENQGHIAALAWFFMEEHMAGKTYVWAPGGRRKRPLWILLKDNGIEVAHYPYGYHLRLDIATFKTFNDILHYDR